MVAAEQKKKKGSTKSTKNNLVVHTSSNLKAMHGSALSTFKVKL
jgi:hypothetical protein